MRRTSRRRVPALALLALAAWLGQTAPAHAEPGEKAKAAWRYEEGKRAMARGKLDEAIAAFSEADAVLKTPQSALSLAQALAKKGRLVSSREVARAGAGIPRDPKEAFSVAKARSELGSLLSDLEKRLPKLRVVTDPMASVTVDGKEVPDEAGARRVDPGAHTVEAALGAKKASAQVSLAEGGDETVKLSVGEATTSPTAPAPARPDAPAEAGDAGPTAPASGARSGPTRADDTEAGKGGTLLTIVGVGLAAAGAGMAVGSMVMSNDRFAALEPSCGASDTCPTHLGGELRDANDMNTLAIVGLGVGGAGLATVLTGIIVSATSGGGDAEVALGPGFVGTKLRF